MIMTITFKPVACSSKDLRAIKKAAVFPRRLHDKHEGRIIPADDAVYSGARKHINVVCTVCDHQWSAIPDKLLNGGTGCPKCYRQRVIASAGKLRTPRSTLEERAYAKFLYEQKGWTYKQIAYFLGRSSHKTVVRWLDPEQREKGRQDSAKWNEENREHKRSLQRRYSTQFEHGREATRAANAKRRALKLNAIHDVFHDGQWHEINMYDQIKGNPVALALHTDPEADKAWKELSTRAEKLSKIAGVPYHIDHLVPLNRGGLHIPENFALRPASENLSKGDKLIDYDSSLYAKRIFGMI